MSQSQPMEKESSTFKKLLRRTKRHGSRGSSFIGDESYSFTSNSSPRSSVRHSKGPSITHSVSLPSNVSSHLNILANSKRNKKLNLSKHDLGLPEFSPVSHSRKHSRSPLRNKFHPNHSQPDIDLEDEDEDDDEDDELPAIPPNSITVTNKFLLPQLKITKAATIVEQKEEEKRKTTLKLIGKPEATLPQSNASTEEQQLRQDQRRTPPSTSTLQPQPDGKEVRNITSNSNLSNKQQQQTGFLSSIMNSLNNLRSFNDLSELKSDNDTVDLSESISLTSPVSPTRQAKDVSFKPLKEHPLSTIGKGGLTLDHFPIHSESTQDDLDTSPLSQAPPITSFANLDYHLTSSGDPNSVSVLDTSSVNGDAVGTRPFKLLPKLNSKALSPVRSSSFRRISSPARPLNTHSNNATDDEIAINQNGLGLRKKLRRSIKEKRNSFDAPTSLSRLSTTHNNDELAEYSEALKKKGDIYTSRLGIKLPNEKRQDAFHQLFGNIPQNELLIEDFTCAYRKDILIQGKLYLSENHVSFHSGIIGLATHFVVPLSKVLSLKKKKTIGIPNAIQFSTLHDKYNFASFIARDAVYDIVQKVRKGSSDLSDLEPEEDDGDSQYIASDYSDDSDEEGNDGVTFPIQGSNNVNGTGKDMTTTDSDNNGGTSDMKKIVADNDSIISDEENMVVDNGTNDKVFNGIPFEGPKEHAPTSNEYDHDPADIKISEETFNAPLGVVYGLLFGDDTSYLRTIIIAQKNTNISAIPAFDNDKQRKYNYIKPLNAPVGPKQTKCLVTESIERDNFEKNVLIIQITETPDVPSGGSFKVKTKLLLSWGPSNTTKLYVATNVVWSSKSWIKGAVEKGSISGQREAISILNQELKKKIQAGGGGPIKSKKKSKRKGKEGVVEENKEEEPLPVVVNEHPKELNWLEYLQNQMDFKTIMMILLFIVVIWDMRSRSNTRSDLDGHYSNGSIGGLFGPNSINLMKSQADLWDWIDSRHSGYSADTDTQVRSIKDQKLKEIISVLEQRLEGLKQASEL